MAFVDKLKTAIRKRYGIEATHRSVPMAALRVVYGNHLWGKAHGGPFLVDLRDTFQSYNILFGRYEIDETEVFRHIVRPGDTVVDIGANIGYYSVLAGRLVGPEGRVLAFEPNPECAYVLRKNISRNQLNDSVQVLQCALSDSSGASTLYVSATGNRGDNRLFNASDDAIFNPGRKRAEVDVRLMTLDEAVPDGAVSVIKMDVQGYEPRALRGMTNVVERSKNLVLITEFWPYGIRNAGGDPIEYLQTLVELGFVFWTVQMLANGVREPLTLNALRRKLDTHDGYASLGEVGHVDLVCVRSDFAHERLAPLWHKAK